MWFEHNLNMRIGAFAKELVSTARQLATLGKGILAADESLTTLGSRFSKINVENTYENREAYRSMLFTTPSLSNYISGAIQFDETLKNKTPEGELLQNILKKANIIPGIKVDKGLSVLSNEETLTTGLDGLEDRVKFYYSQGCRFAKWRGVLKISNKMPSSLAIEENANSLAKYAFICQSNGLVPIVEPEILAEGDHDIETCGAVSTLVYSAVMNALHKHSVLFEGILLKPNMITPGIKSHKKASFQEIAEKTLETLYRTIPPAVPGIMFLSGGQSEEDASSNLNAINQINKGKGPWVLSFSYGRALQASCMKAWQGKNIKAGQETLLHRAKMNSLATIAKYQRENNNGESLHVSNYSY